jgi:hypothetical protein
MTRKYTSAVFFLLVAISIALTTINLYTAYAGPCDDPACSGLPCQWQGAQYTDWFRTADPVCCCTPLKCRICNPS